MKTSNKVHTIEIIFPDENPEDDEKLPEESSEVENEEQRRYPARERKPTKFYGNRVNIVNNDINSNNTPIEPGTVNEAKTCPESNMWIAAMDKEMENMARNNVWTLTDLPDAKNLVKCKWVFKLKRGVDGSIYEHKARLVAQGYSQSYGQDYDETFSPVVRFESIRTLMALAVQYNLYLEQMDVTSAFLNGDLNEEIYMAQPEGYILKEAEGLVCKLNKNLYGLKQSPRCWNYSLDTYLKSINFCQSANDPCMYSSSGGELFFIAVYVDDIILACKSKYNISEVKSLLMSKYQMKDMGKLQYFVGVRVNYDETSCKLWLGQDVYCANFLKKFGMYDCKPVDSPVDTSVKLHTSTCKSDITNKELYQSCVGGLLYLSTKTRPDITFAVNSVAKFCSMPTSEHWTAVIVWGK